MPRRTVLLRLCPTCRPTWVKLVCCLLLDERLLQDERLPVARCIVSCSMRGCLLVKCDCCCALRSGGVWGTAKLSVALVCERSVALLSVGVGYMHCCSIKLLTVVNRKTIVSQ